ncbi:MAG: M6 family metalloprotease domain-containing protein [Candidatus Cloacimonetes bacterium]|nr:M6 family metalloprotease domain-containing protein [Candidatus Cloacimonadota bacterium]
MKKKILFVIVCSFVIINAFAALIENIPMTLEQPYGENFACFASGDEFFNYLHDKNGFTVKQNPVDGYYYFMQEENNKLVFTKYKPNIDDPINNGLTPYALISEKEYKERRQKYSEGIDKTSKPDSRGIINNLVVYIRFSDQTEFPTPRSVFDEKFNADEPGEASMLNYYEEVSYDQLTINSTHYPVCEMTTNYSFQDSYPRSYYTPYNAATNPNGYDGQEKANQRETELLVNAIEFIANEVPEELNLDYNGDDKVDNVCFIIRGTNGAWADLLWAHRFWLYGAYVYINGKRVYDYTFQPVSQNSVSTLCHEMFHSLSAPDLYHYVNDNMDPYGGWDTMNGAFVHMCAYMKWRYGDWIEEIPEITENGFYLLNPLLEPLNNCFKIPSPNSTTEYFVVEYRKQESGTFEDNLPGSGLTISRVNTLYDGEGNASGPPDELYIYRPGGTPNSNGSPNNAHFSANVGRTEFNDTTNPSCFLSNGQDAGIFIHQVGETNETISFILDPQYGLLSGYVVVDEPDFDYSGASVQVHDQTYEVEENGYFLFSIYEGTYDIPVDLNGYSNGTQQVTVIPFIETQIDLFPEYLSPPYNLTYETEAQETLYDVILNWNFDGFDDEDFINFDIFMQMGEYNFINIGFTEATTFTRSVSPIMAYNFYVVATYEDGTSNSSEIISVDFTGNSDDEVIIADDFFINNYPNPFNPTTTISFLTINKLEDTKIEIFNIRGQKIRTLVKNKLEIGNHSVIWNGTDLFNKQVGSGVYLYKISNGGKEIINKMLLMK